jgi:hypothetical protein
MKVTMVGMTDAAVTLECVAAEEVEGLLFQKRATGIVSIAVLPFSLIFFVPILLITSLKEILTSPNALSATDAENRNPSKEPRRAITGLPLSITEGAEAVADMTIRATAVVMMTVLTNDQVAGALRPSVTTSPVRGAIELVGVV